MYLVIGNSLLTTIAYGILAVVCDSDVKCCKRSQASIRRHERTATLQSANDSFV